MAKAKPIFPTAYTIVPNQTAHLYYLGFPEVWKKDLLTIAQRNSPRFKSEYGLPTNALKKMIDNWMEGIVAMRPLTALSNDDHWLTAGTPFTKDQLEKLISIIKVWVAGTYISKTKDTAVKALAKAFIASIKLADISMLASEEEVVLSDGNGMVGEEAYQAIPLIAVNRLLGKELDLQGTKLHLCYCTKNELISRSIKGPENHEYSYVFHFSIQTTPPERHPLLLCDMSIRRWTPGRMNPTRPVKINDAINVHILVGKDKYCQVPISYDSFTREIAWKHQEKECYKIYYGDLPSPEELWEKAESGDGLTVIRN